MSSNFNINNIYCKARNIIETLNAKDGPRDRETDKMSDFIPGKFPVLLILPSAGVELAEKQVLV